MESINQTKDALLEEILRLRQQLEEANDTIEAIRTGQVDALIVEGNHGHQVYTLHTADLIYRVFIEKMTEGAITLNEEGTILYCNSQFATLVGLPLSNVIGINFSEFISPEYLPYYHELFIRCWETDCKGEVKLKNGDTQTPVQLSLTTLELEEGVALSIILTDLTTQKETQKQLTRNNQQLEQINRELEESNHDLQQFASVASHDLQEPLRKIQIFSSLLKNKHHSEFSDESLIYLNKIIDSSSRMKTLIIDILNFSKLSSNEQKPEKTDLKNVVQEVVDDFEFLILEKHASIIISDMPVLEVNRGQIRQVFQNIISNALKFSRPGVFPEIRITGKRLAEKSFSSPEKADGPYSLISIRDNGIGFDEQYLGNIFALFERLHTKEKYEGTGIGLAITKKIIEKHHGLITAKSVEGVGAEFLLILPVDQQNFVIPGN